MWPGIRNGQRLTLECPLMSMKHVNVLLMGSSTECPTTLTSCLITFRMKNMPRANSTISMQPTAATPIFSILPKKQIKLTR